MNSLNQGQSAHIFVGILSIKLCKLYNETYPVFGLRHKLRYHI